MNSKIINLVQFLFILFLLIYIVDLDDKSKKLKIKEVKLIDLYLDLQDNNSKSLDHINKLDDEIKILSSCCANGGLTTKDLEYGD